MSVFTVTDPGNDGPGTLRAEAASAILGDVVTFSPTLDGQTIALTGGEIDLTPGVTIQGPGADQLTIDGKGQSGIFACNQYAYETVTSISGLVLVNGSADAGAAIDFGPFTSDGSLVVSDCLFEGNVATSDGGAIASAANLSVDSSTFFNNRAVAPPVDPSQYDGTPALGGAIWSAGPSMQVTNNNFYINQATGGFGYNGGPGEGGAVAWQADQANFSGYGVSLEVTGNTFAYNATSGGNGSGYYGGDAMGGAVFVDASFTNRMWADVSNNTFNRNTATGGEALYGGNGLGGSLQIGGGAGQDPIFFVEGNQFSNGGAYGGASTAPQGNNSFGLTLTGGAAKGGAVCLDAGEMQSPFFMFYQNNVSGAIAQGGSVATGTDGAAGYAQGGDASGGGVYLDSGTSANAQYYVYADTISGDEAMGGVGGNAGLTGLPGGDASGGGIAADANEANAPFFEIDGSNITNCAAIGGNGGPGLSGSGGPGGTGGFGANSYGGGVVLDPESSVDATYIVSTDSLISDTSTGGQGGAGGYGDHGYRAGSGNAGGMAEGGGLAVEVGLDGFNQEGHGQAVGFEILVSYCQILVDQSVGGKGGDGGGGLYGGKGGNGGFSAGGAASVNGFAPNPTDDVTFENDFLFASGAHGGDGGAGGLSGGLGGEPGGQGGSGAVGVGGGLEVAFAGSVELKSVTIFGNTAAGGQGGLGASESSGDGPNGANGVGIGGGVYVFDVPGGSVRETSDTIIRNNIADLWPDVFGTIGNL